MCKQRREEEEADTGPEDEPGEDKRVWLKEILNRYGAGRGGSCRGVFAHGPTRDERDTARIAAERRMAEWEAAQREDSWAEWQARSSA